MPLLPPCLALIGLFFIAIGFNAVRTGRFADGIEEGHPARVLGGICLAIGLLLIGVGGFYLYKIWNNGY